jgi:hypothetical protein
MPWEESVTVSTVSEETGAQKLGQPLPESYFVSEVKSSVPQTMQ